MASQANRLYRAETDIGFGLNYLSVDEAQAEVESWMSKKWFRDNFDPMELIIRYPVSEGYSEYRRLKDVQEGTSVEYLRISRGCLNQSYLIHELCHALAGVRHADVHGPHFAGILLFVTKKIRGQYLGTKLKVAFTNHKVEWDEFPKG